MIQLLDQNTINQIAAGEVIERPSSVVKELVENAMDSGASAITVEIKEGGLSLIRITDNGCGIEKEEVRQAFLRHATSKITNASDLLHISSLGFRGEALASIAAVAQVEMITKPKGALTGCRYEIHGGVEQAYEEIGCPEGTTLIIRNIFYNTPARKKFMKSAMTEGGYIQELIMRLAMSKPQIAMQFILNGQNKLSTPGNGKMKEVIYQVYGRDITSNLIELNAKDAHMRLTGYIGKPYVSRGNRLFENYFVNGRYMKNTVITKAIEEAYRTFVMVHKFPFTALCLELEPSLLDINVHPTKMEMRYQESDKLYQFIYKEVREALLRKELIPKVTVGSEKVVDKKGQSKIVERGTVERETAEKKATEKRMPESRPAEPFEKVRRENALLHEAPVQVCEHNIQQQVKMVAEAETVYQAASKQEISEEKPVQRNLFEENMLSEAARPKHRLIGQLFQTYWLIEYERQLFIMDQHAAHEKVMYERLMKKLKNAEIFSQQLYPPKVVTISPTEEDALKRNTDLFSRMGFSIEPFGGREYTIRAVPEDIFGIPAEDVFSSLIADLSEESGMLSEEIFVSKLSTMACKAAVKGNTKLSFKEADALIDELLTLENPYNCPHGRPTIISMSEKELEKKFKRIQD